MRLTALSDGHELGLSCFGVLQPLNEEPSTAVKLYKSIQVRNIGRYCKLIRTPLYGKQSMVNHSTQLASFSFDPTACLGVLCNTINCPPDGYVVRHSGIYHFCLPVYRPAKFSGAFYRIAGYMVTQQGYLAVAKRRWLLWLLLALLAGFAFVLSYLVLAYGAQGAMEELQYLWNNIF